MKILLVTRGAQGDVYPYLALADALVKRGHSITLSLPQDFEKQAKASGLNYMLQKFDNIGEMIDEAAQTSQKSRHLLKWMRRVIDVQFEQLIPLLQEHDLLIASNTEFSAASIAEFCKKPVIRTAFGPFIPGKNIPPPMIPYPKPHPVLRPAFFWKMLNISTNFMVKKTINKNRITKGLSPIPNFGMHAAGYCKNFLMYSRHLGSTDPEWKYEWNIGGYCFNDTLIYNRNAYTDLINFIRKDNRPVIFFTLGSCNDKNKNKFCEQLLSLCIRHQYKLVVGSGWSETGNHLKQNESFYLLTEPIPHSFIFPECTAVIHHGGCGTTHSVARAGIPQLIVPLILDQNYWSYRVTQTGIGPEKVSIKCNPRQLEKS
ncbi:MAG: glycosyltransferase [Tannerellaceae bacterium]|nr:glycosyltransferase [Tannerellaceae bacterium]